MITNTKRVKDILLIVLILLLGAISFYLVLGNPKVSLESQLSSNSIEVSLPSENQDDMQKDQFEKKHAFYKQKIAVYERKINALNEQIKQLQQYKEMATRVPDTKDKIANSKQSSPINDNEEMQAEKQQQLAFELEQHLLNESYDSEWAESVEDKMANVMTEELQLDGNELVETICRTTFCRIEIGHENELAESRFLLAIASRNDLINSIEDIVIYRVSAENSGDGKAHSVFFIARKGHQLPVSRID